MRQLRHTYRAGVTRRLVLAAVPAFLLLPFAALGGTGAANAAPSAAATHLCSGTLVSPGTLAGGTYAAVEVRGACQVNAGKAVVTGNVTVDPNGALVAAFAKNTHGSGPSSLTVHGDVVGGNGSAFVLGCEAFEFACFDDPNQTAPTLNSAAFIGGSLIASNPLGVLVHNSTIVGDARQAGGGGGLSCPFGPPFGPGIFGVLHSPAYSTYDDNTIGGNLWVTGLRTCWFGALRNHVGGSISVLHNVAADSDATEFLTNQIRGNIICAGNNPAAQYGDSHGMPNIVSGYGAGECAFSIKSPNPAPGGPLTPISLPAKVSPGYDLGGADGGVFTFGPPFFGSAPGTAEILPNTGIATAPGGLGYWLTNGSGLVRNFGPNGRFFGSAAPLILNSPVVGIAAAPGGDGYWEAGGDGGVFAFGPGAPFMGSAGGVALAKPVVGIAPVPTGDGYDLVASDGGVFTYGPGAHFHGSLGTVPLNGPIVGMAIDPSTGGYWLVGSDGGVFSFDAPFLGSLGNLHLNAPILGIAAAPTGNGYYLVGADGGVFTFGPGARFHGSLGGVHLNQPIDGIAVG